MANTADNQAERDDVAAAPSAAVGAGAMGQLYWESGGARAEKVNIDKAVELKILDETKAALLLGSEVEGDFKRAYDAEKASRKPTFEAFKAAFTAVYGKLRFEKPAVSEKADGKKQSPLVAVMARVLKHNEGLTGEGANFEGHDALRVMACAMDDMSLAHREAQERVPGLRKKKAAQSEQLAGTNEEKKRLDAARSSHQEVLGDTAYLADLLKDLQAAVETLKDAKSKRDAAVSEQGLIAAESKQAKEKATALLKQVDNLKRFLQKFADNLRDGNYQAYNAIVVDFGRKVDAFELDAETFDYEAFGNLLKKDLPGLIAYLEATPLMENPVANADQKPNAIDANKVVLQRQFSIFKRNAVKLAQVAEAVSGYDDSVFDAQNHAGTVDEGELDVKDQEYHYENAKVQLMGHMHLLVSPIEKLQNDPAVIDLLPRVKKDCERFLERYRGFNHVDYGEVEFDDLIKFIEVDFGHFMRGIKARFDDLSAEQAAKLKEVQDELKAIDKDLARLEVGRPKLTEGLKAVSSFAGKLGDEKIKGREAKGDLAVVPAAAPKIAEAAEQYIAKADEFSEQLENDSSVNMNQIVDFAKTVTVPFLENLKSELAALNEADRDVVLEVIGDANSIDGQLAEVKMLIDSSGDPEKRVLEAVFHGMKIGDDGKIKMHGFDFNSADDVAAILEKFDGRKDEAGNVVEVGILPWFGNSKNIGTLRGGIGRLKELGKKMTQGPFVAMLDKYVQGHSTMDLPTLQRRLESEIRVHQSRVLQESKPEDINKEVERQLGMNGYSKSEATIRQELRDRDEEAVRERSLKDGELSQLKADVDETMKLAGEFHEKMSELIAHLSVIVNAGVKLKNANGIEIDFNKIKTNFGGVSKVDAKGLADVYDMLGGLFDNDSNIRNLVVECRGVKESVKAVTSKETPETAKKVVAAMLAEQGVPPAQINDLATAIIRDGVGIIATKKKWEQIAKECQPKALENLQALAFRDKLSKFKMKNGEKESTPFSSLKPENFVDQAATEKTLKNLERTKGRDWLLEYGFIIMGAFKVFEEKSHVDASGQGVVIEKYLKNVLAEKWLDKHPEFDSVNKAMMDSDFVKLIDEEFDRRSERGSARFGEFSDAYDASAAGMKMKLALQIDRKIKVLKAKRKAKTIGKKEYDQQFTALLEQAEEEGVRGMLKEVSPRWKVGQAAFMSGLWNSDFMLGAREKGGNVADWLKAKGKALGATTIGGAVKGGWESMKRLAFGSVVGGVMAPIGITRWLVSGVKNLVLGRWKFASTRAMIGSDFGVAGKYISGGMGKAFTDAAAYTKGMVEKVMKAKSDDVKAKRKEKGETGLELAESDAKALEGKTELDAVEVPDDPYKDITAAFEKKHAALAERKKPTSMRQERPSGQQERLAA